jgi:hypothetical protein
MKTSNDRVIRTTGPVTHRSRSYDTNIRRGSGQIKEETQASHARSSTLSSKGETAEFFKKANRSLRTMVYFYLRHVRKTANQGIEIAREQIRFNKLLRSQTSIVFVNSRKGVHEYEEKKLRSTNLKRTFENLSFSLDGAGAQSH